VNVPQLAAGERCIGVSVAVPDPYCTQLADGRARFGDPEAGHIPPHVTLLGPTRVRDDDLAGIDEHLAAVAAQHHAFTMHLDGAATFRPVSPVVFVQVVDGGAACSALVAGILAGPLDYELRFPYHPHVTVVQGVDDDLLDAAEAGMASYTATFPVTSFCRYEHGTDGVWRPARTFPRSYYTVASNILGIAPEPGASSNPCLGSRTVLARVFRRSGRREGRRGRRRAESWRTRSR